MALLDDQALLRLVDRVYASAADGEWGPALRALVPAWRAFAGDLLVQRDVFGASEGIAPELAVDYARHFRLVDERLHRALRRPGEVLTHARMGLADREFEESEFYRDYARRSGAFYALGLSFVLDGEPLSLSLHRPRRVGEFDDREVAALESLRPHLVRAIRLSRQLARARQDAADAESALDTLPSAVLLLDRQGRPTFVNRAARRVLDRRDGLRLDQGGLRAASPSVTTRLHQLLLKTASLAAGKALDGGGVLHLPRAAGDPIVALVVPLPPSSRLAASTGAAVALVLRDPATEPGPSSRRLGALYGLTPAEARLAAHLAGGETPDEAADALGIARETARSQLKAVFAKTDTRRQGELLRKLALDAALLPEPGPPERAKP
jgi:DNA-binding CsgD family transcriptional regulator/PAS domain-containing protein